MVDPHLANVSLLLPMFGADNGTVFTDHSPSPKTITRYGNAKTVTSESKYYGSSGYFDGDGDYLVTASSASFSYGSGDFTVEFWVRPSSLASCVFIDGRAVGVEGPRLVIWNGAASKFVVYVSGLNRITSTTIYTAGTWYHVCVARASGTTRLFINGIQEGNFSDTAVYTDSRYVIACDRAGTGYFSNGYFQDLRITKGVGRYTENFTPPTKFYTTYFVSGTVYENSLPVSRTVYLLDRATGVLLGSTTSDPVTGEYNFSNLLSNNEVIQLVLGTDDPLYNDVVDRIIPIEEV